MDSINNLQIKNKIWGKLLYRKPVDYEHIYYMNGKNQNAKYYTENDK